MTRNMCKGHFCTTFCNSPREITMDTLVVSRLYDLFAWPHVLMTASKMRKELGDLRGEILEVGSGTGLLTAQLARLPGLRITGVEPSRHMLSRAQERKARLGLENVVFLPDRAQRLPVGSGRFDAVVMSYVMRHIRPEALGDVAGEIARVTRPGGKLLVADVHIPLSAVLPDGIRRTAFGALAVLDPGALAGYMGKRGFDLKSISYYPVSFLLSMEKR